MIYINTVLEKNPNIKRPNKDEYMISMSDVIFKAIIQDQKFRRLLSLILSEVTNYSPSFIYDNLIFVNTELPVENKNERQKITDILATVDGGVINIEANRFLNKSTSSKNNLYHHKIAYDRYLKGMKIDDCEIIQINFNTVKRYGDKLFNQFTLKSDDGKYTDEENFKRIHINMANPWEKYYNYGKEVLSKVEKALVMFQLIKRKEVKELAKGDDDLEIMAKIIDDLNEDENIIGLYDKEQMDEWMHNIDLNEAQNEGIEQGTRIGVEQGSKNKALEIAKNMLQMNMDIGIISKATGLSEKEINELKS